MTWWSGLCWKSLIINHALRMLVGTVHNPILSPMGLSSSPCPYLIGCLGLIYSLQKALSLYFPPHLLAHCGCCSCWVCRFTALSKSKSLPARCQGLCLLSPPHPCPRTLALLPFHHKKSRSGLTSCVLPGTLSAEILLFHHTQPSATPTLVLFLAHGS